MRQYLQKLQDALSSTQNKLEVSTDSEDVKPNHIISVSGGKPVFQPLQRSARFLPPSREFKQKEIETIIATTETTASKILDIFKYFQMDSQNNKVMSPLSLLGGFYLLALTASGSTRMKIVDHFYPSFHEESIFSTSWRSGEVRSFFDIVPPMSYLCEVKCISYACRLRQMNESSFKHTRI